ncbi:hypothetical protein I4U23_015412 [Adineta vaga]|nr:hypothetical protein I4U23_015412 [Adineta vaga]
MYISSTTLALIFLLTVSSWLSAEGAACGAYNPSFYTCCNGVLTFGSGQSCCDTKAYKPSFYTCCNGVLTFGSGQACCGTRAYNPSFYTCCNGALTFGTGLSCGK